MTHTEKRRMFITTNERAEEIALRFREIKNSGGSAAIDYKAGELTLRCTKPSNDPHTWGQGAVPMKMTADWVCLIEC
jgi:hypothetical protein